jgi:hypothetical protein
MAIEQLGKSLLSQVRDRNKKSKKKAKLFTGLMLGVQAGNAILRRRAEKRANEFWKSNQGVLNQRASQFEEGVKFWDGHRSLMKTYGSTGQDDWKTAKKQELYDDYIKRDLGGVKPTTATDLANFKNNVDSKIQDDLLSYEQKLNSYSNFKNISTTAREKSKTAYVNTLRDKLEKSADTITKNDNVGNWLLSQVGIRKKADMQTTNILGGGSILTAGGLSSEERKQLLKDFEESALLDKDIAEAKAMSQYQPMTQEEIQSYMPKGATSVKPINSHATSLGKALSEDPARRQESLLNEYRYTYNEKEGQTVRKIYESIAEENIQKAAIFYNDVLTVSRDLQLAYEEDPNTTDVKDAEYFVDLAVKEVIGTTSKDRVGENFNLQTTMISVTASNGTTAEVPAGAIVSQFENIKTKEEAMKELNVYKEMTKGQPELINYLEKLVRDMFKDKEPNPLAKDSSFFQYNKKFMKNPLGG